MPRVSIPPRYVPINGHRTSFRLEPELWRALRRAATEQCVTMKAFIERVSREKDPSRSLASALRVAICAHFEATAPKVGYFDPTTKFSVRVVDDLPRRKLKRRAILVT